MASLPTADPDHQGGRRQRSRLFESQVSRKRGARMGAAGLAYPARVRRLSAQELVPEKNRVIVRQ